MAISSEDESFISRVHMGQLLTIQKDDLLTKNSSVSGETSHNTNEPEKTDPKHRNGKSSRGKAGSSVWVGNLPQSISRGDIINVFGKFGAVVSVTIKDNPSGNKKYAFVEFGNRSIAQNVLQNAKCNQFRISGHRLKIAARK